MSLRKRYLPVLIAALFGASPAIACTVSPSVAVTLGSYSPAAVKAGAIPALPGRAGINCPSAILTLLGGNFIRATVTTRYSLKLTQDGGAVTIPYILSPDAAATVRFTQGSTIDYMQNNLLNLLGLLGGSSADLPIHVRPSSATSPPVGTYRDRITIDWAWDLCPGGVRVLGACIGLLSASASAGTGTTVVDLTLVVTPQNAVLTTTGTTTWDPVNGTSNPRGVPGSRRRIAIGLQNIDLVPLDAGTLALVHATPAGATVALDGDGTGSGPVIALIDGNPASGASLRYTAPASTTDDVDFSADGAISWGYLPILGDAASARAITHVRLRPQGPVAKQSSFSVSVPYLLR